MTTIKKYMLSTLSLLLLSSHSLSLVIPDDDQETTDGRLPTDVKPSHYSIDLVLDPSASTYDGTVEITFTAADTETNIIHLHSSAESIELKDILLNLKDACNTKTHDTTTDIVEIECPENSIQPENSITINFKGTFSTEDMNGLYKSTYKEGDEDFVLLATQFESVEARRAFPCFDEPALKATFDIFITHPSDYDAIANTPPVKQFSVRADQIQTQFETTPIMSTYLVAFVVSKFVSNTNAENTKYDFKVFSRPSAKEYTNVATKYGPALISELSKWIQIDYNDLGNTQAYQVAIPDFGAGAMENWGLITFREVDLLDEKDITSNAAKQRIITTVAHELAHQWFGDYVTLDWWSNTWLNEGFATYFEYFIPSLLEDNLDTARQFIVNELQPVLQVDALPSAKPLNSDVTTAAQIDDKFDDISYSKGGSIVWMLRNIFGEDIFRQALNSYISSNKYGNTSFDDLIKALLSVSGKYLNGYIDNWIYKSGFPLVTVTYQDSTVKLTQKRFTYDPSIANELEPTEWYIPISFTTETKKNFRDTDSVMWLGPRSYIQLGLEEHGDDWFILNIQQTGYYRVNYDDTLWHRLINALKKDRTQIHVLNRAQLVDDIFNVARGDQVSYEMAFHLADTLVSEKEYYPWVSALNAISFMSGKLNDAETEGLLKARVLYWINKAFPDNKVALSDDHVEILKDVLITDWSCKLGQEMCNANVNKAFADYKKDGTLADINKRGIILCRGFRNSRTAEEDYEFLFDVFKNTPSVVLQNEIIRSLGCTEDPEVLTKYLSETISAETVIRKQDTALVFKAVYSQSEAGLNASLSFLENNLEAIAKAYKGMNALPNLILGLANRIISDDHIERLTTLITKHQEIEEIKLVTQNANEIIATNKKWSKTNSATIKEILKINRNDAVKVSVPTSMLFIIGFSVYYLFNRH